MKIRKLSNISKKDQNMFDKVGMCGIIDLKIGGDLMETMNNETHRVLDIPSKYSSEPTILRVFKKLDNKRRIAIPKMITDAINATDFYIELHEDCIKLIPIKYGIGGNQ